MELLTKKMQVLLLDVAPGNTVASLVQQVFDYIYLHCTLILHL